MENKTKSIGKANQAVTYKEAGLTKGDVYSLIFNKMEKYPDGWESKDIYSIVNEKLAEKSKTLSKQGEKSLRGLMSASYKNDGFFHPYEKEKKWRLTNEGKKKIEEGKKQEELVFNTETGKEETEKSNISNAVKGTMFELYALELLKKMHPFYSWFHQGKQKNNERGLDLIANRIGEEHSKHKTIGVQIKNHKETSAPQNIEWLKFLAGCFARHIEEAIFITTGKLTPDQRREAGEAKVVVIEGIDELNRIAELYKYKTYEEYLNEEYPNEAE